MNLLLLLYGDLGHPERELMRAKRTAHPTLLLKQSSKIQQAFFWPHFKTTNSTAPPTHAINIGFIHIFFFKNFFC